MPYHPLDKVERLVLMNQYAILEKLDPHNTEDYAWSRKVLANGYSWFYSEVLPDNEVPYERCEHVMDILNMFRVLKRSYDALLETDKPWISKDIRFGGFDGNNESDLLSFAQFLKEDALFEESLLGAGDLNSHSMTDHWHNIMLSRYNAIVGEEKFRELTGEEIKKILKLPGDDS